MKVPAINFIACCTHVPLLRTDYLKALKSSFLALRTTITNKPSAKRYYKRETKKYYYECDGF